MNIIQRNSKTITKTTFFFILIASFLCAQSLYADDISNNLGTHLNQRAVHELVKDLAALIGAGTFHSGKTLGFPFGFDVGIHTVAIKTNNNPILSDDSPIAHSESIQAEIGLPKKINLLIRGGAIESAEFYGFGLRYGLIKSEKSTLPSISVSGILNHVSHKTFSGDVMNLNISGSYNIRYIHPYFGIGYDLATIDLKDHMNSGHSITTPSNLDGKQDKLRAEAGLNVSFVPFTYLTLGAGLAHETPIYHVAFGIQF